MSEWARQITFLRVMMEMTQAASSQAVRTSPVSRTLLKGDGAFKADGPMRAFEATLTPIPFSLSPVRRWIETDVEPCDCGNPVYIGGPGR